METRPSIYRLCIDNLVGILTLARASNVHPLIIWDILSGYPTSVDTICQILCGLNEVLGTNYRLDDIQVNLIEKGMPTAGTIQLQGGK